MKTNFGRGTVYEPKAQKTLAEVYYFIQGALPGTIQECQGFLEPILEYEPLLDALKGKSGMLLELENGSRVTIEPTSTKACVNRSLPIFFHTIQKEDLQDCSLDLGA